MSQKLEKCAGDLSQNSTSLSQLKNELEPDPSKTLKLVEQAFELRREFLVHYTGKRLKEFFEKSQSKDQSKQDQVVWLAIDSLSKLRSHVGGRFQNLKNLWLAAGFPLRQHRGDRGSTDFTFEPQGWLVLSSWLLDHGFETRLTPESQEGFFQIKGIQ